MKTTTFIFDLDGVLTDTAHYHYLAWKQIAEIIGVDFNYQENEKLKGIDRVNSLKYLLSKTNNTYTTEEFENLLIEKNQHYLTLIDEIGPANLFAGVLNLFRLLKRRNILIGLASASKNAYKVVNQLRILQEFDYIADANLIACNKPDPEIFLTVAKALGQSPECCVGIEDARAGIQAINSANMFSVGIGKKIQLNQAAIVFPSIKDLNLDDVLKYSANSSRLAFN